MPKAKITNLDGYKCAPEGHTVVFFPFGSIVTGKAAEFALSDRAARMMLDAPETKITPPKETKRKKRIKS